MKSTHLQLLTNSLTHTRARAIQLTGAADIIGAFSHRSRLTCSTSSATAASRSLTHSLNQPTRWLATHASTTTATTNHVHRSSTSHHQHGSTIGGGTIAVGTKVLELDRVLNLSLGGSLPSISINYFDSSFFDPDAHKKPIVYIMPSMSHSALITRTPAQLSSKEGQPGWWEEVVGFGEQSGVNLHQFRVLSASPLGGPYGTTSPLSINPHTGKQYRAAFPRITPLDQARVHAYLLDHLQIDAVHAIVGASMGGMQVLQFAVHYPHRYERVIAICTTGQTSPSTQALRSVQRAAVRMDPFYFNGDYADAPSGQNSGPMNGLGIARMFGTICYRSREEFDARFSNRPIQSTKEADGSTSEQPPSATTTTTPTTAAGSSPSSSSTLPLHLFEVEQYLHHQASTFTGRYDANCYLTLSQCMDLMDLAATPPTTNTTPHPTKRHLSTYDAACHHIPPTKQFLLLPIGSDALIPASEMERLSSLLGSQGKLVHIERIHSLYGHDAFLKEFHVFNSRFHEFLDPQHANGVDRVRQYVNSLVDI